MVGQTLGKYRVTSEIGRGGMGAVYQAVDEMLDRVVALKVLHTGPTAPELLKRFRAEAVTLARLNHPGIATIYELSRDGDQLLLVMEYVQGETFEELSRRSGPLDVDHAARLCAQILDALGHAHRANVIHRDLKPANLMVTRAGAVKIMDFGISRVLGTEHLTMDGMMMGTPAYMAPEQVRGHEVDARSDLYSVGVVLYRLVTAHLPFHAETPIAMAQKHLTDPPTPLRQWRVEFPAWFEQILDRALAKAPAERFQTAEEFRNALLEGMSGAIASSGFVETTPLPVVTADTALRVAEEETTLKGALAAPASRGTPTPSEPTAPLADTAAVGAASGTVVLRKTHLAVAASGIIILAIALGILLIRSPRAAHQAPAAAEPDRAAAVTPQPDPAAVPEPEPKTPAPKGDPLPQQPGGAVDTVPPSPAARSAPEGAAPLVVSDKLKLLVFEQKKTREIDVVLTLAPAGLEFAPARGAGIIEVIPFDDILGITYSKSKAPRWRSPQGDVPVTKVGGMFGFLKGDRHWLTFRTKQQFVVLRLDQSLVATLLPAVESRSGVAIHVAGDTR